MSRDPGRLGKLLSTFGEANMEGAALVIFEKANEWSTWLVLVGYEEMSKREETCGFLQLLHRGWLESPPIGTHGGKVLFGPSRRFVDRLVVKFGAALVGIEGPTFDEPEAYDHWFKDVSGLHIPGMHAGTCDGRCLP